MLIRIDENTLNELMREGIGTVIKNARGAKTIDVIIRKDGIEKAYQADWIKHMQVAKREPETLLRTRMMDAAGITPEVLEPPAEDEPVTANRPGHLMMDAKEAYKLATDLAICRAALERIKRGAEPAKAIAVMTLAACAYKGM